MPVLEWTPAYAVSMCPRGPGLVLFLSSSQTLTLPRPPNFACNSPGALSTFEGEVLKSCGFWVLRSDPNNELHAGIRGKELHDRVVGYLRPYRDCVFPLCHHQTR